jgi:hypothetical protein
MQTARRTAKKLTTLVVLASLILGLIGASLPHAAKAVGPASITFGLVNSTSISLEEGDTADISIAPLTVSGNINETSHVQIHYTIFGDVDSSDFVFNGSTATSGVIEFNFSGGQTLIHVPVSLIDDAVDESDEEMLITLDSITDTNGANELSLEPSQSTFALTAQNYAGDPKIGFTSSESQGSESVSGQIRVTLSRVLGQDVNFQWSTNGLGNTANCFQNTVGTHTFPADLTNCQESLATATIPAGQLFTTLDLGVQEDNLFEDSEIVDLFIVPDATITDDGILTHEYTILDNDLPTVQFQSDSSSGPEGNDSPIIALNLSNPSYQNTQVKIKALNSSSATYHTDWSLSPTDDFTIVTIPAGETTANLQFGVVAENEAESNETAVVQIDAGSLDGATVGTPSTHTYTILDDDTVVAPPVTGTAIPQSTASEGGIPVVGGAPVAVPPTTPTSPTSPTTPTTPASPTQPEQNPGEVLGEQITNIDELIAKLTYGNTGAEVNRLQTGLQQLGFFPAIVKTTQFYGPITKKAVEKYIDSKQWSLDQLAALLHYNNRGVSVASLQTQLRALKFFPYWVRSTGWYGPITQGSVVKYKASK